MATTLSNPARSDDQRIILENVTWDFYSRLLHQVGDQHLFITYDRGRLELMSPSREHDKSGRLLGLLVQILAEELGLELDGGGSTTYRREDLDRGLEPDECFYIANEHRVRGKKQLDLSIDPPPDLVIEIEISRRLLDRQAVYAALGVPEIWCFDGEQLRVLLLGADGNYRPAQRSLSFPTVNIEAIAGLIDEAWSMGQVQWSKRVRKWAVAQRPAH